MRGDFDLSQIGQCGADHARMRRQHHRERPGPGFVIAVIVDRHAHGNAGIVDDDIEPAEMGGDVVDDRRDIVAAGDVEPPGFCNFAARRDFGGYGFGAVGGKIGDRDLGALGGEHARGGAAHAARSTGDENGQSPDRAAELFEIGHAVFSPYSRIDKAGTDPQTGQTKQEQVQTVANIPGLQIRRLETPDCRPLQGHPAGGSEKKSRGFRQHV